MVSPSRGGREVRFRLLQQENTLIGILLFRRPSWQNTCAEGLRARW
jgi:hypothetical protein